MSFPMAFAQAAQLDAARGTRPSVMGPLRLGGLLAEVAGRGEGQEDGCPGQDEESCEREDGGLEVGAGEVAVVDGCEILLVSGG